ncbi:MAG: hypothetical protein H6Q72_2643 [Firmicutes bacterium]|nr:hypothetical protein [Bacillota bacterium]
MSEDQPTIAEAQPKWNRKKISALIVAAIFLAGISFFQLAAGKVRQAAEQSLLVRANQAVNGKIVVGSIDLSILGSVAAKDVELLDMSGNLLAKSKRIQIGYNWSDLLKGQLGPQLITGVTIEQPEIWIVYNQNGLNWSGISKPKEEEESTFSGLVEIEDGKLHMETAYFTKTMEAVTGKVNFRQKNLLGLAGTGRVDQSAVKIDGQWGKAGDSAVTIVGTNLDMVKLNLTTADSPIRLTGGILDELTIKLGKDTSDEVVLQTLAGRFSGLTTAGALELTQGSARFEKLDGAIQFMDGQALYQGQSVTAAGRVLTATDGTGTLDFAAQMPAGNPAVLLPSLRTGGSLAVQATITGSVLAPVLAGNFTLGSIQFGDMAVSGISGAFSYTQQVLKLLASRGAAKGGSVTASGDVYPDKEAFSLSISGSGLDSSQLTEKDVKGPLSLVGTANGNASTAVVQGTFSINNGAAYGIAFKTLTGNFVKHGSAAAEVSNLAMRTGLGTFYPEQLSQSIMEELQSRKLPVTETQVKEAVADALLKKIFR